MASNNADLYRSRILRAIPSDLRKAYEEGTLDDNDLLDLAQAYRIDPPEDFSGVKSGIDSTARAEPKGWSERLDRLVERDQEVFEKSAAGGAQRSVGGLLATAADEMAGVTGTIRDSFSKAGPAGQVLAAANPFVQAGEFAEDTVIPAAAKLRATGAKSVEEADALIAQMDPGVYQTLLQGAADVSASPTSLASLPGGAFAALPMADVYSQEYAEAREAGLDRADARVLASRAAAPEGIAYLPAGKLGGALAKRAGLDAGKYAVLQTTKSKVAGRLAQVSVGEGLEEGTTEALQILNNMNLSKSDREEIARYASAQIPTDVWASIKRATVAGMMGGAAVGGPATSYQTVAEAGRQAAEMQTKLNTAVELSTGVGRRAADQAAADKAVSNEIQVQDIPRQQQTDTLRQAEQQRVKDEAEAAFRNEERVKQNQVDESYGEPPTYPQMLRGEDIKAERELAEQQAEQARVAKERAELDPYLKSADKDLKASAKKRLANAKSRHQAAKRKNTATLIQQAEQLPAEQRAEFLARQKLEWDRANPAPTAESVAPVVQAEPAPAQTPEAPQTATQAVSEPVVEPALAAATPAPEAPADTNTAIEQDLRSQYGGGLESQTGTPATGATAQQVADGIMKKYGSQREANVLAELVGSGKVALVDSADQIPGRDPNAGRTQGYYDGDVVYLVANELDPKNVKGSLLVVAAHEGKHVGDLTDNKAVKGSFKNLLGDEANQRIIQKAEAEAAKNPNSLSAKAVARASKVDKSVYELELPAYLIEEAQKARAARDPLSAAARDLVSSVRTKYRNLTGNEDIDMNDMAYLGQKLLEEIAVTPDSVQSSSLGQGVDSIAGPKGLEQAEREGIVTGRAYVDSEGVKRAVVPDKGSSLNAGAVDKLINGRIVKAGTLLAHDTLFRLYPELAGLEVMGVNLQKDNAMYFPSVEGVRKPSVAINKALLESGDMDAIRSSLLHELQHGVQEIEAVDGGVDYKGLEPPQLKGLVKSYNETMKEYQTISTFYYDKVKSTLRLNPGAIPVEERGRIFSIISGVGKVEDKIIDINNLLAAKNLAPKIGLSPERTEFLKVNKEINALAGEVNSIRAEAFRKYLANKGESEARFTQYTMDMSLEEMEDQGYTLGGNPETMWRERGNVMGDKMRFPTVPGLSSLKEDTVDQMQEVKSVITGEGLDKAINLSKGLFSKFGVLGRELKNIQELSDSEASSIAYIAKGNYHRLGFGISTMATRIKGPNETLGQAKQRVNKKIDVLMEEMSTIEEHGRREAMLSRFVQSNPELQPLQDALNDINEQSERILRSRMADPKELSNEEIAKYAAIHKNKFLYLNRTFAAFQGEAGSQWAKRLHDEWAMAKQQAAQGKGVSKKYQDAYRIYSRAVKFVMDNEVNISDPEKLAAKDMANIERMYSMWVEDAGELKKRMENSGNYSNPQELARERKATMVTAISAAVESATPYKIESKSEAVVKAMLNLTEGNDPTTRYLRGFKQDKSILLTKEHVPQELRDLFGEITDWPTKVAITLSKQGELVARHRALNLIREKHHGTHVINEAERGDKPEYEQFTARLDGEGWGPLEGMFTTPTIKAALTDLTDTYSSTVDAVARASVSVDPLVDKITSNVVGRGLVKVAGLQKLMSIVFSGFTVAANAAGSSLVLVQHGVVNPDHGARALKAALHLVDSQFRPKGKVGKEGAPGRNEDLELFIKYGLLESATMEEIRRSPQHFVKELIKQTEGVTSYQELQNAMNKAKDKTSELTEAWKEIFAMSDAWTRPAVFLDRTDFLTKVNELEGNGWTQDEIYRRAADYAKDTTITFTRAAPIVKAAERVGLTTFMPYFQTVFNSLIQTSVYGVKDLLAASNATSPELKALYAAQGAKKLVGTVAATGGAAAFTKMISSILNSDDEDEENEGWIAGAKKLLFHEARFGDGVYLGKDKNGNPLFFRLGRLDPLGPANDLFRIAMSDEGTVEDRARDIVQGFTELYFANRAVGNALELGGNILFDLPAREKTTKTERIAPTLSDWFKEQAEGVYGLDYSDGESIINFIDSFVPGIANALDENNVTPETDAGVNDRILANVITLIGGRLDKADPAAAARGASWELANHRKEVRKVIADTTATRGPEAGFNRYLDALDDEQGHFRRMQEIYDGMEEMGMSPRQIAEVMKDTKRVDATDLALLRQRRTSATVQEWGTKWSRLLSEESLNKRGELRDRDLTEEEKRQRERERKEINKRLNIMRKNI